MILDFSNVDMDEQPILILKSQPSKEYRLGALGYAYNLKCDFSYNNMSQITFDYPKYCDGKLVPFYNKLISDRIVEIPNVGDFILTNPAHSGDGIKTVKSCTAKSAEHEFTFKDITLEKAAYNFWSPVSPADTILGIVLEKMPTWSIGEIDSDLIGNYHVFEITSKVNLYNFLKSTIQESYNCVINFDIKNRTINAVSANSIVKTAPVYLSFDNLIKKDDVKEDSDNVFTCLDVSGAEGVNIRSVNPMGTNQIYNFDPYMNTDNFSQIVIDKYEDWKATYESYQLSYYNTTIEQVLQIQRQLTETAKLTDLQNADLKSLTEVQSTYIEMSKRYPDDEYVINALADINTQIAEKQTEIQAQEALLNEIAESISTLTYQLQEINGITSFTAFFTSEELLLLDRYIKEGSISEPSFATSSTNSYTTADITTGLTDLTFVIEAAVVTKINNAVNKDLYSIAGGTIYCPEDYNIINAQVIKAAFERNSSGSIVFTAYLSSGSANGVDFPSGCISMTGVSMVVSDDTTPDIDVPDAYSIGTRLEFHVEEVTFYLTQNVTEYEARSVEWDLFDYGQTLLNKLVYPSNSFTIDSANFLASEKFKSFKNNLSLGNKVYVKIEDDKNPLEPMLLDVSLSYEDKSSFTVKFSDTYSAVDNEFDIANLLDQSISMGKTVDASKYNYSAFMSSGANTTVDQLMKNALDVSKNVVLSSSGQSVLIDSAGTHLKKENSSGGYEDEQIRMINNGIYFTSDNWSSVELAIGKFTDTNFGTMYGICAPAIMGTLLAGENLLIESVTEDGGVKLFRFDADGAKLHNATFDITNESNQISINPDIGIVAGTYPVYTTDSDGNTTVNETNAKFWFDIETGEALFSGVVNAADYQINGSSILTGDKISANYLNLKGLTITNDDNVTTLTIDSSGNITMVGDIDASNLKIKGNTIINSDGQITANYISLGGAKIVDADGDSYLTIDSQGNIIMGGNSTLITGFATVSESLYAQVLTSVTSNITNLTSSLVTTPKISFTGVNGSNAVMGQLVGNDSESVTDNLLSLVSNTGLEIIANNGGIRLQPTNGVWINGDFNIMINGSYYSLTEIIPKLMSSTGVTATEVTE